ncbi:MAG: uncharacterized membrane protein YraQ (UPF0718 family) [Gammaproteobacteria bacterium]
MSDEINTALTPIPIKKRLHILLRASFGYTFWLFAGFALLMGMICYFLLGPEIFKEAVSHDVDNLLSILPRVVAALTLAGFIWILMPRDKFSTLVGRYKGFTGLVLAEIAGIITPGGPSAAFPFLAIIGRAGADKGVMITYITSWALLGIQRVLVWDLPFMGAEVTATRFLVSLPLPIIAGLIAQQLPLKIKLGEDSEQK